MFEYIDGGAEDGLTQRRNTEGFRDWCLRPRMGVWVPEPEVGTTLFGERISMPVLTAPCGGMRLVHPEGDIGVARGAAAAGTIPIASAASQFSLEEIADHEPGPKWFQLFKFGGRAGMERLVQRAQAAGYHALVLTLDSQVRAKRESDWRNGFSYEMLVNAKSAVRMAPQVAPRPLWILRYARDGMPFQVANTVGMDGLKAAMPLSEIGATSQAPTWEDVAWCRENWRGPVLVKGVLTADDARRALELGCDGVIVSNHGGRMLDTAVAAVDALPAIVAAVGDRMEVLLDGGMRRGTDVVKALCLGAKAVVVGRPYVFGLAIGGQAGVEHVLELYRSEIARSLQLMGCESVAQLGPEWIARVGDTVTDAPAGHRSHAPLSTTVESGVA